MDYRVPELGEGVYQAEFVEWLVRPGQQIQRGQGLAEVLTDKATIELPAPFSGVIDEVAVQPGQTIEVGQAILRYTPDSGAAADRRAEGSARVPEATRARSAGVRRRDPGASDAVSAAPAVRRLARAIGVDLHDVPGSGPAGRVLIDDLGAFVRARRSDAPAGAPRRTGMPDLGTPGARVKLQGVRRLIAKHMVVSTRTIPHYSYIDECDVTAMVALRDELKRPLYAQGVKLTSLPFFVKAVVAALQRVPLINASLDEQADEIVMHDEYHIGIATATAQGLLVPVIHRADQLDLVRTAREIERLIRGAQAGTLARDELRGSTFTISSVGNIGGLVSTPIINHPEVGILAIGKVFQRPSYNESGAIVPARVAYLSFSFDHRVVDGGVGALFGNAVIDRLKEPRSLLD